MTRKDEQCERMRNHFTSTGQPNQDYKYRLETLATIELKMYKDLHTIETTKFRERETIARIQNQYNARHNTEQSRTAVMMSESNRRSTQPGLKNSTEITRKLRQ